jgi:orotate phosphoribosyltransferase
MCADATSVDLLATMPARRGHFLLESGCHTDVWLTLDAVFVDPAAAAPLVAALAERLRRHAPTAVCGSLVGGAFLAQALAAALGVRFYFSEPAPPSRSSGLFTAQYRLPPELARRIRGERLAVVDDVISAGSSARATVRASAEAGAQIAVVGALMSLGGAGAAYFAAERIPVEALGYRDFNLWAPGECPRCAAGEPLEDPLR